MPLLMHSHIGESGIKHVRNDAGKALSRQAYYEATDPARMFVSVQQRE